ncbi:hypothetical protein K502DRAFT_328544 [Neoconidiobolus thromboides FSU 785]|nr:hypothetical protein K502DRAFT_328544 [Neoconidiobolus thromboides FSU 785]
MFYSIDLFLDGFINNIKKQQKGECLGSILAIKEFKLINIELILMILNLLKGNNKEEEKEEDIERLLNQNEFDDKNINNSIIIGLFYELKDKKDVVQEHLFKNGLFKVIMKENFKLKIVNLLVNFMSYLFKNSSNSNNVSQLIELILNSITIQQLNDYNFMNQIYFVLFKSIKQNSNINLSSSLTNTFFIKIMEQPNNFIKYNYFILLKFINNNKLQLELNFKLFNNNNLIYYEYLFGKDENIKIENIENKSLNDNEIKIINNKEDNDPFDSDEEIESEIDINTILNNNNNNNNLIKEPRNLVELIEYFKEKENVEYNQLAIQHMKSIIHNSDLQQLNKESQQLIKILLKLENNDDKKREEELALRKEMIVYILKKSFYSCIDIYLQFILEDKLNLFNTLIAVDGLIDLINSIDNLQQQQQQQQTINNNNNNQIGNLKWKSKNILLNQTNNKSILTNNNNNKLKQE